MSEWLWVVGVALVSLTEPNRTEQRWPRMIKYPLIQRFYFCSVEPNHLSLLQSITIQSKMAPPANAPSSTSMSNGNENLTLRLEASYGDFRDDLARDGFVVVKGAVPRVRADGYADKFYSYLEGLYVIQSESPIAPSSIFNFSFD